LFHQSHSSEESPAGVARQTPIVNSYSVKNLKKGWLLTHKILRNIPFQTLFTVTYKINYNLENVFYLLVALLYRKRHLSLTIYKESINGK
jgi:hypothetical protein